ncbi:Unknown protein sequence [Pseudomonas coronafaciens pv. oryzae]|nr:Unknown protein sequence [Pseudomonas coronafaciens pv. oryzae]
MRYSIRPRPLNSGGRQAAQAVRTSRELYHRSQPPPRREPTGSGIR